LLPLSWVDETQSHVIFPGETWEGRTWIEGNRVARNRELLAAVSSPSFGDFELRYLLPDGSMPGPYEVDEVGYHFVPARYGHSAQAYLGEFSHKSAKRLMKELDTFEARGYEIRINHLPDFDHLIGLNLSRFGAASYFYDIRFADAFTDLMQLCHRNGWLRLTTVVMDGRPAAVDFGCLFNGNYTLLAGGTHPDYPGIAKLINMHHIRHACEEKYRDVDFLCGAFSWKTLFHLEARPLYKLASRSAARMEERTCSRQAVS
jgi:hypothetical protein